MQFFVRRACPMIAASVQGDVDGISKGSHDVLLKRANDPSSVVRLQRKAAHTKYKR